MMNGRGAMRHLVCAWLTMTLGVLGLMAMPSAMASTPQGPREAQALSPDGQIQVTVTAPDGRPTYAVRRAGAVVVEPSRLGFRFASGPNLEDDLAIVAVKTAAADTTWEQPWGERRLVRDRHNELEVTFARSEKPRERFIVRVRIFDDGVGFRYEVGAWPGVARRQIADELTEFRIPRPARAWWIPGGRWNRYEYLYQSTALDDVAIAHTPITLKSDTGPYVSIHEAALVDYAAMWLDHRRPGVLRAVLSPRGDGTRVVTGATFKTPWRTIQISPTAYGLANSDLILNLNEPNALGNVSYIQPGKYVGIWWGMHLGKWTWGSGERHGATTENTKRYIDFAAQHGMRGVLVEGWNEGWDGDWFSNGEIFSFTKPYKDFDLEGLAAYARSKGVHLIGHHETAAAIGNYERQMGAAFDLYRRLGIDVVKTGYVADGGGMTWRDGGGVRRNEWHDNQFAVDHHLRVVRAAAQRRIAVMPHEPVKDTGLRRTYPNWVSREGARGQEYNAWGDPVNPPEHVALLPFTRLLAGPMDFTPGIFDLMPYGPDNKTRIQSTLAQQLALYVTIYSPFQMAADLPENYAARPDAFRFIENVPTDWEQSIALAGEVGDFFVMARQKRAAKDWYVGAVTDEIARTLTVPLDFLTPGVRYEATLYRDGPGADWKSNPYAIVIEKKAVTRSDVLTLPLGAGGGAAVEIKPMERQ